MKLREHLERMTGESEQSRKPALVVQGGGMRGIYSLGALAALEDAGLRDAFSVVVGSSAGAINSAYFLAGQANYGLGIYFDDLSHRKFISPRRLWRVVDVDYLVDDVLKQRHPLDIAALKASPVELLIVLTDADTGEAHVVSVKDDHDLHEVMRATAALPALYNKRIALAGLPGRRYIDGGIVAPVPLEQALATGATQALVVMTRAFGFKQDDLGGGMRFLGRMLARGHRPFVKENISTPNPIYAALLARLREEHLEMPRATWTVAPKDIAVNRTMTDPKTLEATACTARADMMATLEQEYHPHSGRPLATSEESA